MGFLPLGASIGLLFRLFKLRRRTFFPFWKFHPRMSCGHRGRWA